MARRAAAAKYRGMVIDLEGFTAPDRDLLATVVRAFADSVRARGARPIAVAVPAVDTATFPGRSLVPAVDYLLVMLYDQHWMMSAPGPVASPDWVRSALALRVAEVGAEHVIAALPLYGYRWRGRGASPRFVDGNPPRDEPRRLGFVGE